ncbi:DUF4148 domain-containing protein [Rhodoferax sp.]|uniref:DUF4148 domain-containing protein n=1 Tax=Rhodoferax sp. TaxID=50421 RepID=UPI00274528F8|nr:DUF4148 domain-containing protein [Rhodoferax sp.]
MTSKFSATALIIGCGLLAAGPAFAGATQEQVRAELSQAIRAGESIGSGEFAARPRDLYPNRYPVKPEQSSVAREQVKAELVQAIRTGDSLSVTGLKGNELYPHRYPAKPLQSGRTRDQVKGELSQAMRTGEFVGNGELADD